MKVEYTKSGFHAFRKDLLEALKELETKYECKIEAGNITYDTTDFTIQLKVVDASVSEEDLFMQDVKNSYLFAYPITASMYKSWFTAIDGKKYQLVGVKRNSKKKPLIIRDEKGKEYVTSPEYLGITQRGVNN